MTDYKEILSAYKARRAELQKRRDELDQEIADCDGAIRTTEKMISSQPIHFAFKTSHSLFRAAPTESADYRDMTIRDAAAKCLRVHGRPMRAGEIAEALLAGGFETAAEDFKKTVYGTLQRYAEEFHTDAGRWSLTEG